MRSFALAVMLAAGFVSSTSAGGEFTGPARRLGIGSSAGYHVYDACPWLHTRHTDLAHSVCGFYYGGHPCYHLSSPNAGFYSTQWCNIAPFGPSYAGLHNYMPSAPYRGVYPLTGCCEDGVPVWSDVEGSVIEETAPPAAENVDPGKADAAPTPPTVEAKPAKATIKRPAVKRSARVSQTAQPIVRPVR